MAGPLAAVGAGEFLEGMVEVDRYLLTQCRAADQAKVLILPTASAPEGDEVFWRWGNMGIEHFERLGAAPEVLPVRFREDALDPALVARAAQSDFIYFSGGSPRVLLDAIADSPLWGAIYDAWSNGAALAGCSAGAIIFGEMTRAFRAPAGASDAFGPALGLIPGTIILPHFDRWPLERRQPVREEMPADLLMIGIDEHTALVWGEDCWRVMGKSAVTIWATDSLMRYTNGKEVPLSPPRADDSDLVP
jgi:cyanophycinase